ncbi:ABC transporter permease [Actinoplanes sp. TRM 88003]|uniref:ABC transporter permease n=1 Tax=Paractinoplanes aksuensis TaxID=2939490 RepID=A0ABT1DYP3_9ACTN|nr:FtsX-like permease family protein [Actinoplanes aksuensis]MCO8275151.1 ABC transporter permease [Actinoplanes aksuensis]
MTPLHWPSIRGRARADAGPLLLVALVVTVVALLAGATPPVLRSTSDEATRDAVRRAADDAAVRVEAEWPDDYGPNGGRVRAPLLADDVASLAHLAEGELEPSLRSALQPPVATVSSISMAVTDGSVQRRLQLEYLHSGDDGPAVTWIAGKAPGPSTPDESIEIPLNGAPWPMQIGLSEAEATVLGAKPGDRIPVQDDRRTPYDVRVSGIFRPVDPADPAWRLAPWLLQPAANRDGLGSTRFGGLLSDESLSDARLAFRSDQLRRSVRFDADPGTLTWESAQALASAVATLKGLSAVSAERDTSLKWATQLDSVLRDLRNQIATASAQAAVLLIAVLAGALLVVSLAADLLTRRRTPALTTARQRGAGLPTIAAELAVESTVVAVPAAALGLALAAVVTGSAALTWVVPFLVLAVAAGPAFGTLAAARATRDKRAPANRSARRWALRTVLLRRAAIDVAVVVLAIGALVALRQRGIGTAEDGDVGLPAAAPTLGALAAALLLVRLLPAGTGAALKLSLRSRRPLVLFAAARAAATASRLLPALAVTAAIALASFAITLHATTDRGLSDGAWQAVGADVQLTLGTEAAGSTAEIAQQVAAAPGVRHAVAARVVDSERFIADNTSIVARLVVVDTAALRQLRAGTPLAGLPDPGGLTTAVDGTVPALVRTSDDSLRPGTSFRLPLRTNTFTPMTAVGPAPAIGSGDDVVVVDRAAAAAAGLESAPNTVWATGPGAAAAIRATGADGRLTTRAEVLDERRTAPLTAGLVRLQLVAAGTLLALGLLGFALAAAAGAPQRWETLARLRTLGLRPRDAHRVAAGELLPVALVAAVSGPLLGALLSWLTVGPLALNVLTGQVAVPVTVVPWWTVEVVAVVALTVVLAAVVATESAVRKKRRLGDVLRVSS